MEGERREPGSVRRISQASWICEESGEGGNAAGFGWWAWTHKCTESRTHLEKFNAPAQALTLRLCPDRVIDEVEVAQLGERLGRSTSGHLSILLFDMKDLEVDELLDARERRDLVVRNPDLLERI